MLGCRSLESSLTGGSLSKFCVFRADKKLSMASVPEMESDWLKTQNYSSQIARGRLNFDIVSLFLRLLSISLMRSFTLFVCFVCKSDERCMLLRV
jgi:hypothetical protein